MGTSGQMCGATPKCFKSIPECYIEGSKVAFNIVVSLELQNTYVKNFEWLIF